MTGDIVGVVPDFSLTSVKEEIAPVAYYVSRNCGHINVKLTGRAIPETLAAVDLLWKAAGAPYPIKRYFLDDHIQNLYLTMLRETQLFGFFAGIAILLACLGLTGLAASTVQRRTGEIGLRKAMGATTGQITRLLLWEFSRPVLWASLIAWPASAILMNRWLEGFAYHVDLDPLLFVAATAFALVIALLTVSAHCYLVARSKPVKALRHE
jgi:putative ABC transport system permease protein